MNIKNNPILLPLLIMLMTVIFTAASAADRVETSVGRVTLVIGKAYAINKEGQKKRIKQSDMLFEGDSVETNSGAHVHVRFIDDARISIRPESRLNIETYHYDPKIPENSEIRFYLHKGVLRSISGKATEAAHDRYRMNTPIAALGVLGTDYVVRTDLETTWAAVYSGAISLAPITNGCNHLGLGTCVNATELTERMSGKYLEVNIGDASSQLKSQINEVRYAQVDEQEHGNGGNKGLKPGVVSGNINESENGLASNEKLAILSAVSSSELAWLRWPWQARNTADTVSQVRSPDNEDKEITVGNLYAGLFRAPSTLLELQPQAGVFNFTLQNSHVFFVQNGTQLINAAGRLDKANLQIDFGKRQFNTQLEIFHQQTGLVDLNVTGNVSNDGLFRGNSENGNVAGALTLDGKNVGLQFQRDLEDGSLKGITEWKRK